MSLIDSDAGTELFASHEADLKLVQTDVTQKLDQIQELTGEARKAAIRAIERAVDEAEEIVCAPLKIFSLSLSGRLTNMWNRL